MFCLQVVQHSETTSKNASVPSLRVQTFETPEAGKHTSSPLPGALYDWQGRDWPPSYAAVDRRDHGVIHFLFHVHTSGLFIFGPFQLRLEPG